LDAMELILAAMADKPMAYAPVAFGSSPLAEPAHVAAHEETRAHAPLLESIKADPETKRSSTRAQVESLARPGAGLSQHELKRPRLFDEAVRPIGDGDDVQSVLEALVLHVERLSSYRAPGRTTRNGPTAEENARRVDLLLAEGPSAFLAFAIGHRNADTAADDGDFAVQEEARSIVTKWREAPAVTRAAFAEIAAAERGLTEASLKCKSHDRNSRLNDARHRLFSLHPGSIAP